MAKITLTSLHKSNLEMRKTLKKIVFTIDTLAISVAKGFAAVDERFEKVDERFKKVDDRFNKVDERFDKIDERFEGVDGKIEGVERKIEGVETKIGGLQTDITLLKIGQEDIIMRLDNKVNKIDLPFFKKKFKN